MTGAISLIPLTSIEQLALSTDVTVARRVALANACCWQRALRTVVPELARRTGNGKCAHGKNPMVYGMGAKSLMDAARIDAQRFKVFGQRLRAVVESAAHVEKAIAPANLLLYVCYVR